MEVAFKIVSVFLPFLLLMSAVGWGTLILRKGYFSFSGFLEAVAFRALLGLGWMGLLFLIMGMLGWFYPWCLWGILGIGPACLRPSDLKIPIREVAGQRRDLFSFIFLSLTGLIVLLTFAKAFLPITTADELSYHLYLPKLFLLKHRVFYSIDHVNSAFPLLTELLYSYGIMLGHPIAIKGVHFLFGVLTACLLCGFSKRIHKSCPAWWASALFLTVPIVNHQMALGNNDLALTAFLLGAYVALFRWFEEEKIQWLILSGLFSGFAMGVKYLAFLSLVLQASMIAVYLWHKKKQARNFIFTYSIWGAAVLLVSGIWYMRSYLTTGNPVYPYLTGYFVSKGFEHPLQLEGKGFGKGILSLLLLPWNATFSPHVFGGTGNQWGPLFLLFLPWIFLVRPAKEGLWRAVLWVSAGMTLIWFYSKQNLRFLLPALPFFCLAVCLILRELSQRVPAIRTSARLVFLIFIGLHLGIAIFQLRDDTQFLLGREEEDAYLSRRNPVYTVAKVLNKREGKKAKILSEEYWAYDFDGVVVRERAYRRFSHYPEVFKGREKEWIEALKVEGFTHLLIKKQVGQTEKSYLEGMIDVAGFPFDKLTLVHESGYPPDGEKEIEYRLYRIED